MNRRGKKPEGKRGASMSFSELVQHMAQRDAFEAEPKLKKLKLTKATPKSPKRRSK
jgi:hypothetical protein